MRCASVNVFGAWRAPEFEESPERQEAIAAAIHAFLRHIKGAT